MNIITPSPILKAIYMLIDLPSHNTDNKPARIKKYQNLHIYIQSRKKKKKKKTKLHISILVVVGHCYAWQLRV